MSISGSGSGSTSNSNGDLVERGIHLAPPVRYSWSMAEARAFEMVEDCPHNVIDFDGRFDSEEGA